jgi:hypothetical protein
MNFIVFYDKIYLSNLDSKSGQNKPAGQARWRSQARY